MSNDEARLAVEAAGVVPVVTLPSPHLALPVCAALLAGGLGVIEITFRTVYAAEAIAIVSDGLPEMLVGAGTITSPEQVSQAAAAGAGFAVAPGLNPDVLAAAEREGLPFWPGVCTPGEIEAALGMGLDTLKYFPAGAMGGPSTIKAVMAPYSHLEVGVIPTGGINADNVRDYWALDSVIAVGGSWIAPKSAIEDGDWTGITQRARAAVEGYSELVRARESAE